MDGAMTKAPLGGKRSARIQPTVGRSGPNGACSPTAAACPLASPSRAPIGMTSRWAMRRSQYPGRASGPAPEKPQGMCLDKGYDFDEVRELLAEFRFTAHIRARGEEAQAMKREAGYKAHRWVVERTHSWMNRFRRLLVRWERKCAIIWRFCIWRVPISPTDDLVYWDRLLARLYPIMRHSTAHL